MSAIPTRLTIAAAFLAAGSAAVGLAPVANAHDPKHHATPEHRVELIFGRTEDFDYDPPEPGSYRLPALRTAADGAVLDPQGQPDSLHELMRGRVTVLAFIYTRCSDPKGCPLSIGLLYDLKYVSESDPVIGENLRLIALSFDPEYDTPEVMAQYGTGAEARADDGAALLFLTTRSAAELEPILKAYDQPIGRKADAEDPFGPFTHQLRVFLIDRQQRIRNIYSLGFLDPRLVITDVRTLLLEEHGAIPEG
jgi:cytochrome oxidase Cu insertion factor (SCO1/SenC/PrrC family)